MLLTDLNLKNGLDSFSNLFLCRLTKGKAYTSLKSALPMVSSDREGINNKIRLHQ